MVGFPYWNDLDRSSASLRLRKCKWVVAHRSPTTTVQLKLSGPLHQSLPPTPAQYRLTRSLRDSTVRKMSSC